ncbi:putative sulfate exporter family transporter [Vibrio sp. FNV 38]|nr:putative sulfate exporter family transporter [Vibrio sp. FNV 38]
MKKIIIFCVAALVCLTPWVSSPLALILGFALSCFGLVPDTIDVSKWTKKLLAYSIIGLGFGIHFQEALTVTSNGLSLIITSIISTFVIGMILAKLLKLDTVLSYLISAGTAICGGSAIAAVAPAIRAKDQQIGLALATIFVLNSIALFVFPVIGHALNLDQVTFGTWAAIAIHDTSSVVGAASAYGEEALITATTLKLSRALWIVPVAFISAVIFKNDNGKITIPYFIIFYCIAILVSDFFPQFDVAYQGIFAIAKQTLVLCLFLIGSAISIEKLKAAGFKPMILGVSLWGFISVSSLLWLTK